MLPKKYQAFKPKLRVGKSDAGLGLFAGEDLKKGAFVIEYVGEILTRKESNERGGKYLFETSDNRIIDGSARSNTARYINHSCTPNCEVDIRRGHVLIFTTRAIKEGEELLYDYGEEYFDEYIKKGGCRCRTCASKKK